MDQIARFDTDFVTRTREILITYDGPHDMSIIINCLLGLVILPFERIKQSNDNYWDKDFSAIPNLPSFRQHVFDPIERVQQSGTIIRYPKTLRVLLRKLRNGIAHQHIAPINNGGNFVAVEFKNYYEARDKTQYLDMHLEFSQQELSSFALFVADEYLRHA